MILSEEPTDSLEAVDELAVRALKSPAGRNAFLDLLDGYGQIKQQSLEELAAYFSVILTSYQHDGDRDPEVLFKIINLS